MPGYVWIYFVALLIFLAIDAVWLFTAGRTIYVSEIGSLLRDKPNFVVAFIFYLIFVAGLVSFVIQPALQADITQNDIWHIILRGGFFGLVAYATYDMTNLSTLKDFTVRIALIDMAWGTFLSAAVSGGTVALIRSYWP